MQGKSSTMRPTPNAQRPTPNAQRPTPNAQPNFCLKFFGTLFRAIISCFLALVILTFLCSFYFSGLLNVSDPDHATDLRFIASAPYVYAMEGYSRGKNNNEGYINLSDYQTGMSLDVLVMGSSHMEALQVMPQDNTANVLGVLSGKKLYNIGQSAHFLPRCATHLEAAVKKYNPLEFVVIESNSVVFSDETLTKVLNHGIATLDKTRGKLRLFMRKNAFLFLIHKQVANVIKGYFPKRNEISSTNSEQNNSVLLNAVLNKMSATVRENSSAKLIIAYHPTVALNEDGSLKIEGNPEAVKIFSDLCKENGIYFIDMGERFLSEYQKNFTLPYGFFNTSVGTGHMNKDGHRMFAEEIYKLMQKIERGEI